MEPDKNQTPTSSAKSTPDSKAGQELRDEVSQDLETAKTVAADKIEEARELTKDKAEKLKQQATEKAKAKGDEATTEAGQQIEELSNTIDAVASTLSEEDREGLADYARQMSSGMTNLAERLQNQSVDELANDVKKMARENPNGFLLGSIALGFGLSRFGKASANRDDDDNNSDTDTDRRTNTTGYSAPENPADSTPSTASNQAMATDQSPVQTSHPGGQA